LTGKLPDANWAWFDDDGVQAGSPESTAGFNPAGVCALKSRLTWNRRIADRPSGAGQTGFVV